MNRLLAVLLCIFGLLMAAPAVFAQYDYTPYPYGQEEDTTKAAAADMAKRDTTQIKPDSLKAPVEEEAVPQMEVEEEVAAPDPTAVLNWSHMWIRRLLFRGQLNTLHIGGYAQYQLTSWAEGVGSYGPVEGRFSVYYLGTTEWMGQDAEWLQIAVNTMGGDPSLIEYDVLVPSAVDIDRVFRVLYRVERGPLQALSFALPEGVMDYDAMDSPADEGHAELEIFFDTFDAAKLRGSGTDGAEVVLYMDNQVPPLGIVQMGYGESALTLTDHGSNANPRFYSPPPPKAP